MQNYGYTEHISSMVKSRTSTQLQWRDSYFPHTNLRVVTMGWTCSSHKRKNCMNNLSSLDVIMNGEFGRWWKNLWPYQSALSELFWRYSENHKESSIRIVSSSANFWNPNLRASSALLCFHYLSTRDGGNQTTGNNDALYGRCCGI
jgi:hypothetical protein